MDFDGRAHRVPLTLDKGVDLANTILQTCAKPLSLEARRVVAAGGTLTFGPIQLARTGITVRGAHASWDDIRFARLQSGRMALFKRSRFFAWRTVRLDRIPNPGVFCTIVGQNVRNVWRDDNLLIDIDAPSSSSDTDFALRDVLIGGAAFLIGLTVTLATYSANHAYYLIAVGPMLYGSLRFVRGLVAFGAGRSR